MVGGLSYSVCHTQYTPRGMHTIVELSYSVVCHTQYTQEICIQLIVVVLCRLSHTIHPRGMHTIDSCRVMSFVTHNIPKRYAYK